jgi:integrase
MSEEQREYTVQRFRGGFAIVWWENDEEGKPKRRRIQLAAQDRPSAEAEARVRWEVGDDNSWAVGRIMKGYLASIADKPSHQRREDAWKAMKTFWENVDPDLIDEPMCRAYRKTRKVADGTVRYELLQLSTALRWARKERHITAEPPLWLPPVGESQTRHLTRAEFDRFFAAVKADHAKVYVMLGLFTMARPSAILDLTWDRVDFARRQIDFRPPGRAQTAKRRVVVPIGDELLETLQTAYKSRTCEYVVEHGGGPVASIKKAFQAASERSGVHATPYTLRHTGAVWAAEAGVPMSQLAQFMGHDDDRTTQKHYARFSPDFLRGVVDAIGSIGRK